MSLLRKAIQDDPNDIVSWGFLGRELLAMGELEEAAQVLGTAEKLAPKFPYYARLSELRADFCRH
ncbi:tetratricopeptide repeat protein [Alicyclobacillus dauci]|uniref:Tetratricopeptide repeat protein n=1 Tax=Alicyclobacillus dauci TaxID=1475485 RepID=A0ABY6Z2J5_9BACL|nr:tetratricopeptide repeat protein [Alicyclobacillus dauci]WAH36738.1 tetratricopeptide repeat protein [Alicyclobacillus dauci]